jgi:hypothetical protein
MKRTLCVVDISSHAICSLSIIADDEDTPFKTSAGDLLKISNGAIFEVILCRSVLEN